MKYLIIFFLPFSMVSQTITGKIYDSETTIKGIDIFNISKRIRAYSDDDGNFTIKASVGDTLSFHSIFHNQKIIQLKPNDFENTMVIELIKTINRLHEILLKNNIDPASFNAVKEKETIKESISQDSEVNPHLYGTSSQYGLDFIRLAGLVGKLLKSKKAKDIPDEIMTSKDLDSLFKHDDFFNQSLLTQDLRIPEIQNQLFFELCEANGINKNLIKNENKLLLLEELVVLSDMHLKNLESVDKN